MKSPEKFSEKETERRFRKALAGAFSMRPIENKDIRAKRAAKKKSIGRAKRASEPSTE